ncbi:GDP-mannose mannosyl hydrolase [Collimonas antrihumi]|uniref:GDP-mannose mannosyl hydrolase n=1 Tax=Collimonas antrihumi TaxID=1940615 RepID=UPI001B8B3A77|nr:GDP-mannose mannosyl hydrolase [Collimonas antrihumi]
MDNNSHSSLDICAHQSAEFSHQVNANILREDSVPASATTAFLDAGTFAAVIASTPLIAIDLIVEDEHGAVLLGLRNNPPAQGYWFVPGGRIRKDETRNDAFARLAQEELGLQAVMTQSRCVGIYEHFYDTNFNGTPGATTHYIVLAYCLRIKRESLQLPLEQHSQYIWMQRDQIVQRADVHPYAQAYFLN